MRSLKIIIRVGTQQNIFLLHGEEVCSTIDEVKKFCFSRFPHLEQDKNLRMFWIDQDSDEICVITDGDYSSFLLAEDTEKGRLYVEGKGMAEVVQTVPEPPVADGSRPQHIHVVCDVCDQMIVGHRYRCLMCHDYDLCMACESKYRHKDHIMLRIPRATDTRHSHQVLAKMEFYAGQLKLEEEHPSQVPLVDEGKKEERTNPQGQSKFYPNSFMGRRNCAMRTANAAAAAMVQDRAQARFREVLSRYIDPANISGPAASSPSSSSTSSSATANTTASSPSTTAHDELLTEAQRSLKIASDAAKVASAAATASWNTFMGCAGMFVPPGTQNTTPKQPSPTGTGATTPSSSNGSVVAGLVDGVLKHTPPELKEFVPTEDEINRLSEKLSNMLSSLGIEFTGESSTSSTRKETEQKTPEQEKDSQPSSMSSGKEEKQEQEVATAGNLPEVSSEGKQPLLETDNVVASSSQKDDGKLTEEEKGQATENIDCSADTSSASMLTDDDEDVVEAAQVSEQSTPPQALSSQRKVPWILVDLPDDREEEVKQANTPSSVPVASSTPSSSPEKVDDKQTPEETSPKEQPEVEEFYANTFKTMIDLVKQLTVDPNGAERKVSEMIERSQKEMNKHAQDDRYKAHLEKAAVELQKHLLEVKMKEQTERQNEALQQSAKDKKSMAQASTSTRVLSPTTSPLPSTSASPRASNGSNIIYSPRPHVNQAIHTMMTMGFSNNDGHLSRLLEALDGDIQRALDMLMQNLS